MKAPQIEPAAPPPAGSMRWYAWLFTPEQFRRLIAAILALESEWNSMTAARVDHGVAHLKLQWWKEEIERLRNGEPRHPLTQELMRRAPNPAAVAESLVDRLASLDLELACASYESEAQCEEYLALADGIWRSAASAVAGAGRHRQLEETARAAGQFIRRIEIIRDLPQDAIDGRIYLPLEWLAERGLTHAALRAPDGNDGVRACLTRLASHARGQARIALAGIDAISTPALRGLRVLVRLHGELLDHIERADFAVRSRPVELGPATCLWTAWRAARQH